MKYNSEFNRLPSSYLFAETRKIAALAEASGKRKIIDLGVGDVREPLFECVVKAMETACRELGEKSTFRGYPPADGYSFLREKIAAYEGCGLSADEIFVADGAKGELGNVLELFATGSKVLFPVPSYPAGFEANILRGNRVSTLVTTAEDGFIPSPPEDGEYDLIYLCSPQNPTGATLDADTLSQWINFALKIGAVVIFDAAYREFVRDGEIKSVYSIPDAKKCAIEINSFSKSLGFTGIRCGYTVVPKELGELNRLKNRYLGCRFNGVSYVTQRGAEAFFSDEGLSKTRERITFYKSNAEILKNALKKKNLWYNSTCASPYAFVKCPEGYSSRDFCSFAAENLGLIFTPGDGFCGGGEGYVRLSAFCSREDAEEAAERIKNAIF